MALYELNEAQHATVLAALAYYGERLDEWSAENLWVGIASKGGTILPLTGNDVGQLTKSLNHKGLDFGAVVNLLSADDSNPYVAAAHEHRLLSEGTLEVDPSTVISEGDDGAYVMAWLWVSNEAAGTKETGE